MVDEGLFFSVVLLLFYGWLPAFVIISPPVAFLVGMYLGGNGGWGSFALGALPGIALVFVTRVPWGTIWVPPTAAIGILLTVTILWVLWVGVFAAGYRLSADKTIMAAVLTLPLSLLASATLALVLGFGLFFWSWALMPPTELITWTLYAGSGVVVVVEILIFVAARNILRWKRYLSNAD